MTSPLAPGAALPIRPVVVEASAGTGKTYSITGLVARWVAAGTSLDRMLVITFTRAATAELRHRVRERLAGIRDAVAAVDDPTQPRLGELDEVVRSVLDTAPPSTLRRRFDAAVSDVDGAAISTIHTFCNRALDGLGLAAGLDRRSTLEDLDLLLRDEVMHEVGLQRVVATGTPLVTSTWWLEHYLRAGTEPSQPDVVPPDRREATELNDLIRRARGELRDRKREARWMSYDDLLVRLRDALRDPATGAAVAAGLRRRYEVVLVDEFQDTDPVQWEILRLAFGTAPLVLVGDPKQAIYSFRGADVGAYVAARGHVGADHVHGLDVSYRSDQRLLDAYNVLLDGALLGGDIVYRRMSAAGRQPPRIHGLDPDAALRVRVVLDDGADRGGARSVPQRRHLVARDVAAHVAELLAGDVTIDDGDRRPLAPGDVAVLVRTNTEAATVQAQLGAAGVPAVINGAGSVHGTPAAGDWLLLLRALQRPHVESTARAAATTPLLGWDAADVADADEARWVALHDQLHDLAAHLLATSPSSLWRRLRAEHHVAARLLGAVGGERRLMDLDHVAELLHDAWSGGAVMAHDLAAWLERAIASADDVAVAPDTQARRLESDDDAVQVVTVHRSKGLEFPVVCCASLWTKPWFPGTVATGEEDGRAVIDVGSPEQSSRKKQRIRADLDEELRLLYVALTRAKHHAIVWWADADRDAKGAPLSRVLFCRRHGRANTRCDEALVPKDPELLLSRVRDVFEGHDVSVRVEPVTDVPPVEPRPRPRPADGPLGLATLDRAPDPTWRRTSYTALTRTLHAEPAETGVVTDEELSAVGDDHGRPPGPSAPLPLGDLPGGTAVGTYVHALLEHADFTADDPRGELARVAATWVGWRPLDGPDHETLLDGLVDVLATPCLDGRALRDVPRGDRLDEMTFELPLAADDADARVRLTDLRHILEDAASDDPLLAAYLPRLTDDAAHAGVHGFLTGAIDLVARDDGRYTVVDYKSNRLTPWDATPHRADYGPAPMRDAMLRGHYPLQALLYLVALHRYLRWRLGAGYDPGLALGGATYLFVRGMTGAHAEPIDGVVPGVHTWRPDPDVVARVSSLLHRGRA